MTIHAASCKRTRTFLIHTHAREKTERDNYIYIIYIIYILLRLYDLNLILSVILTMWKPIETRARQRGENEKKKGEKKT